MYAYFPIHASAVLTEKGLNLFCAKSGVGKSTLAVNLYERGFPIFTDDKCVLTWDKTKQHFLAEPSIRVIRLWQNTIDKLSNPETFANGKPVIAKENKFQINIDEIMLNGPQLVQRIFIIIPSPEGSPFKMGFVSGAPKIKLLKAQIHRPELIIGDKMKQAHHEFFQNIAEHLPTYIIRRPEGTPINVFVDFVASRLNKQLKYE